MVEPIKPAMRAALKGENDGLSDATIDRLEELTSLRFQVDPEKEPERLAAIDREREKILSEQIPRYREAERKAKGIAPAPAADLP